MRWSSVLSHRITIVTICALSASASNMTTDSTVALWAAFHSAKEALLLHLESPMPYTQHILLTPAAKRDIARVSLQGEIVQGKLDLLEMRSVQERFSHAAQLVVKRSERAQTLLSPCAGMPVEIVRQILLCALTPEEPRAIIRASSVCSTWRSVILKEPYLFTHADWNRWPNWLIKDWCCRARDRLLHVELGNRTPVPKVVYYQYYSDYDQLKAATSGLWGELRFTSRQGFRREALVLPLLQSLQIDYSQPKDDRPSVVPVTLPNVRRIDIEGVALRPTLPLTNLVELSVTPLCDSEDWGTYYSTWSQILRMSPALVKLTIRTSLDYEGFSVDPRAPPIAIPTLQSLTFVDDDCGHHRSFTSLLLAWSLPSLRQFRTVDMGDYCSNAEAVRFLDALVHITDSVILLIMHTAHIISTDSLCAAFRVFADRR